MTTRMPENRDRPSGVPDHGSFRVTYGIPERDLATQTIRHRRFYSWTEDGRRCGSWTWQPGFPPQEAPS